jgi:hypothetical protein
MSTVSRMLVSGQKIGSCEVLPAFALVRAGKPREEFFSIPLVESIVPKFDFSESKLLVGIQESEGEVM